jgi:hypothetical protein
LLQLKSKADFTVDNVADVGPVGTKKNPVVLVSALQSLNQALMNDNDTNKYIVGELDVFLCPNMDGESSLMSKITSLDAQLVTARNRILRTSARLKCLHTKYRKRNQMMNW